MLHVHVVHPGLCSCMNSRTVLKHTSSNRAKANKVYAALTLVKRTGLGVSNVLGHGLRSVALPLFKSGQYLQM